MKVATFFFMLTFIRRRSLISLGGQVKKVSQINACVPKYFCCWAVTDLWEHVTSNWRGAWRSCESPGGCTFEWLTGQGWMFQTSVLALFHLLWMHLNSSRLGWHESPKDRCFWHQQFHAAERMLRSICFPAYFYLFIFLTLLEEDFKQKGLFNHHPHFKAHLPPFHTRPVFCFSVCMFMDICISWFPLSSFPLPFLTPLHPFPSSRSVSRCVNK